MLTVEDALQTEISADDAETDELAVTLPARSLREVERLMASWKGNDPVSLFCERGQVVVLAADQMVTSRTLEGTYPNYRQLIPDGFSRTIDLRSEGFYFRLGTHRCLGRPTQQCGPHRD